MTCLSSSYFDRLICHLKQNIFQTKTIIIETSETYKGDTIDSDSFI